MKRAKRAYRPDTLEAWEAETRAHENQIYLNQFSEIEEKHENLTAEKVYPIKEPIDEGQRFFLTICFVIGGYLLFAVVCAVLADMFAFLTNFVALIFWGSFFIGVFFLFPFAILCAKRAGVFEHW